MNEKVSTPTRHPMTPNYLEFQISDRSRDDMSRGELDAPDARIDGLEGELDAPDARIDGLEGELAELQLQILDELEVDHG